MNIMFQNEYVRRIQVFGFVISFAVLVLLAGFGLWEKYFPDNSLRYGINNYFNDCKIEKIRIYYGSNPDESKFIKEIIDSKVIFGFVQSINKSSEYEPNHPVSGKYYFTRVFIEGNSHYDFQITFIDQDGYAYIEDFNNSAPDMKSKSLCHWFYANKIY